MITNVYTANLAGEEIFKYAMEKNEKTGKERLLERHELNDPDYIEVGDSLAYKVSILNDRVYKPQDTY